MTPRLEACYFGGGPGHEFDALAQVLAYSAAEHCAAWRRTIVRLHPRTPRCETGILSHIHNTQKLAHWRQVLEAADDGDEVLLLDADLLLLRPLDDIWTRPFDLAYTTKEHPFPFNLGVLFVRVSAGVRRFMRLWQEENDRLILDGQHARTWRRKFGGVNQAAFGLLRERGALSELALLELGCAEWNCEESAWARFDPAVTRILHMKGALRRALFGHQIAAPEHLPLIRRWRDAQRDAVAAETVPS